MANGTPWTADQISVLRVMWLDNKSSEVIGRAVGRTSNSVGNKAKFLGLGVRLGPVIGANGKSVFTRTKAPRSAAHLPDEEHHAEQVGVGRDLLRLANEQHLDDLDAGGYPDASTTELLDPPDRYVPLYRQRLYSSQAGAR